MSKEETRSQQLSPEAWTFADFTLDLNRGCLMRHGQVVKLRPKSFETLKYLVEHHERLVTKEELIQAVWPDSFVTDDSLVQCLRDVRAALGDQQQRYVKTVPRRGYIFDLAVTSPGSTSSTGYEQQEELQIVVEQTESARLGLTTKVLSLTAAIVVVVSMSAGIYFYRRSVNLEWLKASVTRVDELAQSKSYFEAYDLATEVLKRRAEEPTIDKLMPTISDDLSVDSNPEGARVYLRRFALDESATPARQAIGTTPIHHLRVARGEYIISVEKDGYATFERTVSSQLNRVEHWLGVQPGIQVQAHLIEQGNLPENMVFVPGGDYALVGWGQPTQAAVKLDDYFIDKYEVTNRDYKEFITAGGYLRKQFWRHAFISGGKEIPWEAAMNELKDRTGLPGPRNWTGGEFPEGKAEHPVTNITWYEASAYAEFKGKQLPSVFQWEKAARDGAVSHFVPFVMPWGASVERGVEKRANLQGTSTVASHAFEFGMSPYGCYQMAGNVTEWALNRRDDGFITLGGSYADPFYIFGDYGQLPAFYSSDTLGFRCARTPHATSDQHIVLQSEANPPAYKASSEASFQAWLTHYRYDQTPLNAQTVETVDTPEWKREKITYSGADEERAIAYLYLPKNAQPPFQLIQYIPGGPAYAGYPPTEGLEFGVYAPHIKLGRAVLVMILKGQMERPFPEGYKRADRTTVQYRERLIKTSIDVRRGLDYIQTRNEIDSTRIALLGISLSIQGITYSAVEPRYRSVVFLGFGVYKYQINNIAEANPIFFAPHIRPPKLMLNGRYDEDFPFKSAAEPLYKLLREPKRLELFDGGHCPPPEVSVPVVKRWLDEILGEVKTIAVQGS